MVQILDGKKLSEKIIENLKQKISQLGTKPSLAVILVGDNPASQIYVRNKQRKAEYLGFNSIVIPLPENISENDLLEQICILNDDENINAILVQLPLPKHINKQRIIEAIDPIKDVDGFTSLNFGKLALNYTPYALPCTPKGILRILDESNIEIEGKNVLVIGRSNIVGKPVALMLQARNATVTMAHRKTRNLKEIAKSQDIIISAIGKSNFITKEFIKDNAIVIDVGINRTDSGLTGDVDFDEVKEIASYITPVPGGIGPMTIAMLMENTFELYELQKKLIL